MNTIYFSQGTQGFRQGILALSEEYSFRPSFTKKEGAIELTAETTDADLLRVDFREKRAVITYRSPVHFFRGLGHLLETLAENKTELCLREECFFTSNGPMFDVSQGNAVIRPEILKGFLRKMALMGLNTLMLYCEDSYDVPSQPYFGYMRSRYSHQQMKELDDYAALFGIEMIPCIQTLAHLNCVLKWKVYKDFSEDMDTLLVGDERTYDFLEQIIRAASAPFRTKRIHIGMDEAMMLGQGNYLKKNGLVPKAQILKEHLERVMAITRRLGLKPMMWSDMFLRALSEKGDDYYSDAAVSEEVKNAVPEDVTLVYWDYYHDTPEFYEKYVQKHRIFGEPVFAGGIWTWMGYGPNYAKTLKTTHPALTACKNTGVKEILATVWGDNGTECSVLATLPMLQVFAEHGYRREEPSEELLRRRFAFICKGNYDDFLLLQRLDEAPGVPEGNWRDHNFSKALMWQDILSGLADHNFDGLPLNAHYEALASSLAQRCPSCGEYASFFAMNRELCRVLSRKAEAGLRLRRAYLNKDEETLKDYASRLLPELRERVIALKNSHREHWFSLYLPLGWDIYDMRYGALLARIDSAVWELERYLDGELPSLPELEEPRLPYNGDEGPVHYTNYYGKIVSASRIDPKPLYPHYLG